MSVPTPSPGRKSLEVDASDDLVVYRRSFGSLANQFFDTGASAHLLSATVTLTKKLLSSAEPILAPGIATPLRDVEGPQAECYWSVTYHGPTRQSVDGFLRLAKSRVHTVLPKPRSTTAMRRHTTYLEPPQPVEYDTIARVCLGRGGHFTLWAEPDPELSHGPGAAVCSHYSSQHAIAICQA